MSSSHELLDQWYRDTANRAQLELLLRDPVLDFALRICAAKASERVPPPSVPCSLLEYGAMVGFTRNGAFEALENLENLSKQRKARPAQAPPFDTEAQSKLTGARPAT